jgi:hypothetical protein
MKKLILAMIVVAISMVTVHAQEKSSTKISIAANAGIPTSSGISFAAGGDLQADFGKITLSAGYETFSFKDDLGTSSFIPVLAGLKFPFSDSWYGHAQLGYGFGKISDNNAFAFATSIGYKLSSKFDASVKYLGFTRDGGSVGSINLRLAYSF